MGGARSDIMAIGNTLSELVSKRFSKPQTFSPGHQSAHRDPTRGRHGSPSPPELSHLSHTSRSSRRSPSRSRKERERPRSASSHGSTSPSGSWAPYLIQRLRSQRKQKRPTVRSAQGAERESLAQGIGRWSRALASKQKPQRFFRARWKNAWAGGVIGGARSGRRPD